MSSSDYIKLALCKSPASVLRPPLPGRPPQHPELSARIRLPASSFVASPEHCKLSRQDQAWRCAAAGCAFVVVQAPAGYQHFKGRTPEIPGGLAFLEMTASRPASLEFKSETTKLGSASGFWEDRR